MTYNYETFWPGPNFNVTVGPNGSGKSSIVTALSIALGGDLASLNRQTKVADLVNANSESKQALVEIELFVKEGKNMVVTCTFDTQNPPEWKLQGKPCSKKQLKETMEQFQIQPGNLCQFLPQDVVRDFPNMKNQEIFYNTVKAIGDQKLTDDFNDLKAIEKEIKNIEDQKEMKEKTIENLERKESKLADSRVLMMKRKGVEEKKLTIENAIKWQKFHSFRTEVRGMRIEVKKLREDIENLELEEVPIAKFLESYEKKVARLKEVLESLDKEFNASSNKIENFEIADEEDRLEFLVGEEKYLESSEKDRVNNKRKICNEIAELKAQIQTTVVDPNIDENIQELVRKRELKENLLSRLEQQKSEVEFKKNSTKKELDNLMKRRENICNMSQRKLNTLQKENKDAYQGVLWLRENLNMFSKPVHEPIMLCLDVKNQEYAKLVETQIGKSDLEGFVCESPEDVNILTKQLREGLGLRRINAFHSDPEHYSKFPHKVPVKELAKYDFQEYLSDMYDAPPAVQAYLCRQKKLNEIPYFAKENRYSDELGHRFTTYFVENQKFNSKKSKYSGELSTGCEDISTRKTVRLNTTVNREQEQLIVSELKIKEVKLKQEEDRYNKMVKEYTIISDTLDSFQTKITKLRSDKSIMSKLQSELTMKEKTLANCKDPKLDLKVEKRRFANEKRKTVLELSNKMSLRRDLAKAAIDKEIERKILLVSYQSLEFENSENLEKQERFRKELDAKRAEHKEADKIFKDESGNLQAIHNAAKQATGTLELVHTDTGKVEKIAYKPAEIWATRFSLIGATDEHVLGALLDDYDTELKLSKKIPDKIIQDLEINQQKLTEARREKTKFDQDMIKKTQEVNKLKRDWTHRVEEMVQNIDEKFSHMMAQLGYAGQISLSQGRRDIDFSSYGISIMVRFRDGQDLQELSRGVQSGGEKSVTTAVYMMALQELTQVPFRCVDEINQGMDERNERLVWDQLLKVCRKYKAQYFYMAPKFPYSLPFDDQVNIVVCNNGFVSKASHRSYRMKTFVNSAIKLNQQ